MATQPQPSPPRPSRWHTAQQAIRRRFAPVGDKPRARVRWICHPFDGLPHPVSDDPNIEIGWGWRRLI
jgi:hypothetical protein